MSERVMGGGRCPARARISRRDFLAGATALGALVALGGCSQPAAPAKDAQPKSGGQQAGPSSGEAVYVTIAATAIGNAQYAMGAGLADLLSKKLPNVKSTVITTTGTIDRLKRFSDGKVEFGWTEPLAGFELFTKTGQFANAKGSNILGIAGGNWSVLQVFTLERTKIKTAKDLKGKRIGLGMPGSTGLETSRAWIEANGISMQDVQGQEISPDEQTSALKDDQLDVAIVQTGPGAAAIKEITTSEKVVFLPTEDDAMKKLLAKYPPYAATQIPAKTYKDQDQAVPALGYRVAMIVRDDLGEELTYGITKTIFDNLDSLATGNKNWADTTYENALDGLPFPLHKGALRYYQERKHPALDAFMAKMRAQKLIP